MSGLRRPTLEQQLAKIKPISYDEYGGREEQHRQTRRLYFSLPKLVNDPSITNDTKGGSIQLYKFPESPLNSTKGFKKFKPLETSNEGDNPLQKILKSVRQNSTEAMRYNRRFSEQKSSLMSVLEKELAREQELSKRVRAVNTSKPILTSLKMKQAQVKVQDRPPEYSEYLQNIIFPQYRKELQRKHQQKLKEEEDIRQKYLEALTVKIKQSTISSYGQPPECRQGCQIFNYNDKIYVLGGASNNLRHTIQVMDLKNSRWDRFEIDGYRRRSFHNAITYDIDKVLLVCGFREAGTHDKKRLAQSLEIIDLEKRVIKVLTLPNLKKIEPRYAQASAFIDTGVLLISGGRTLEKFKKDCFLVDIDTGEVEKCKDLSFEEGLAHHTVVFADKTVYLFGGRTGTGELTNEMFSFNITTKTFESVQAHGKPPPPCYGHVMNYFAKQNVIFIYGGRNDMLENPFLNQITLFHVGLAMYTDVNDLQKIREVRRKESEEERARYCFAGSFNSESLVYLYGGSNTEGFSNAITFFKFDMRILPKI